MSKIKSGGLDQYSTEAFEQQQFGTAGVERVKQKFYLMMYPERDESTTSSQDSGT